MQTTERGTLRGNSDIFSKTLKTKHGAVALVACLNWRQVYGFSLLFASFIPKSP